MDEYDTKDGAATNSGVGHIPPAPRATWTSSEAESQAVFDLEQMVNCVTPGYATASRLGPGSARMHGFMANTGLFGVGLAAYGWAR